MEEPSGNNDPRDPLNPGLEEEDRPNAPLGDPTADVDAFEDEEAPETVQTLNEMEEDAAAGVTTPGGSDDEESELEELDEEQFEDFDPSALEIPARPTAVDESNVGLLGVHKRKRTEEEERERKEKRKKKDGKREKSKKSKKKADGDDVDGDFEYGEEIEGKRARKSKVGADGRPAKTVRRARSPPEADDETLTPEERKSKIMFLYCRSSYLTC